MEKKTYEQPQTVVVKLQHKEHLLQASQSANTQMNVMYEEEDL